MSYQVRVLVAFWISLAMSWSARADTVQQREWEAATGFVEAFNTAVRNRDAAALGALYAEDAMVVAPEGIISGRSAIQAWASEGFKVFSEQAKLERVEMLNGSVRLRTGTWSGVLQTPNGPVNLKGRWATTDVLERGLWKIRMESFNVTPPAFG